MGSHQRQSSGFSLPELLIAMAITLGIVLVVFQMFVQNERVFRDQSLVLEMQQNARAVATMIADEIRMAGQGVPVYAAIHDATVAEAAQTILDGSDGDTIRFRAGIRNGLAIVTDSPPLTYTLGSSASISVDSAQAIFDVVGSSTGRHVFLWGPTDISWTWVRAEITNIPGSMNTLQVTPTQISGEGNTFEGPPRVALEEGISYSLNNGSILRGTTTAFTNLTAPTFAESAVGENFSVLQFTYYDGAGAAVAPSSLALRSAVRRVDFVLQAETSDPLSGGETGTYAVSMSISPRNLEID